MCTRVYVVGEGAERLRDFIAKIASHTLAVGAVKEYIPYEYIKIGTKATFFTSPAF